MSNQTPATASLLPPERLGPFSPAGLLATVQCRDKNNGRVVRINRDDHGSNRFPRTRFVELTGDELDELELEQADSQAKPVRHSLFDETELATMRVAQLKALPEYDQIPEKTRKKLREKQNYVDAILQIRKSVPATPRGRETF